MSAERIERTAFCPIAPRSILSKPGFAVRVTAQPPH
jgi:hypothetical protein